MSVYCIESVGIDWEHIALQRSHHFPREYWRRMIISLYDIAREKHTVQYCNVLFALHVMFEVVKKWHRSHTRHVKVPIFN